MFWPASGSLIHLPQKQTEANVTENMFRRRRGLYGGRWMLGAGSFFQGLSFDRRPGFDVASLSLAALAISALVLAERFVANTSKRLGAKLSASSSRLISSSES
jgi:hypothetical protein